MEHADVFDRFHLSPSPSLSSLLFHRCFYSKDTTATQLWTRSHSCHRSVNNCFQGGRAGEQHRKPGFSPLSFRGQNTIENGKKQGGMNVDQETGELNRFYFFVSF